MQIKTLGLAAAMSAVLGAPALAEDAVGHWFGKVTTPVGVDLTITAHINRAAAGGLEGYAESPDQMPAPRESRRARRARRPLPSRSQAGATSPSIPSSSRTTGVWAANQRGR